MDKYFVEYSICPPFLERSLRKTKPSKIKHEILPIRPCCSVYIMGIKSLDISVLPDSIYIKGYQENSITRYNNIEMDIEFKNGINHAQKRICTFNCDDITNLYILLKRGPEKKFFISEFSGCKTTRGSKILLYELKMFKKNTFFRESKQPSYQLITKVLNYKSKNENAPLHYNWSSMKRTLPSSPCLIELLGVEYTLDCNKCIFCFKIYDNLENLSNHINISHYNYKSHIEKRENVLCKLQILRIYYHSTGETSLLDNTAIGFNGSQLVEGKSYLSAEETAIFSIKGIQFEFSFRKKEKRMGNKLKQLPSCVTSRFRTREFDTDPNDHAEQFRYFYARKLTEIIDLKPRHLNLMIQWNDFIHLKRIKDKLPPFYTLAQEFVLSLDDKYTLFDLFILFYQKSLLTRKEIMSLIAHKKKNFTIS